MGLGRYFGLVLFCSAITNVGAQQVDENGFPIWNKPTPPAELKSYKELRTGNSQWSGVYNPWGGDEVYGGAVAPIMPSPYGQRTWNTIGGGESRSEPNSQSANDRFQQPNQFVPQAGMTVPGYPGGYGFPGGYPGFYSPYSRGGAGFLPGYSSGYTPYGGQSLGMPFLPGLWGW